MESTGKTFDPSMKQALDEYDTLQAIVDDLRLGNYKNEQGDLMLNLAFIKLEQLAIKEAGREPLSGSDSDDGQLFEKEQVQPHEAFHIEADIDDIGEYSNLLVIPCNDTYIVVSGNEHLCTLMRACDTPDCWEQRDGSLEDEVTEKIGNEIDRYIQSFND